MPSLKPQSDWTADPRIPALVNLIRADPPEYRGEDVVDGFPRAARYVGGAKVPGTRRWAVNAIYDIYRDWIIDQPRDVAAPDPVAFISEVLVAASEKEAA